MEEMTWRRLSETLVGGGGRNLSGKWERGKNTIAGVGGGGAGGGALEEEEQETGAQKIEVQGSFQIY
jgi:hypothetical protein